MMPLLSVCIPSYNRPQELLRLLKSIDVVDGVEIVICEDKSPLRPVIRKTVREFGKKSKNKLIYCENTRNFGYDKNLRELMRRARGEYIVFMGDDDVFVPGALRKFISFLKKNSAAGYVLRAYDLVHRDGKIEPFKYYGNTVRRFAPGFPALTALFRKGVFISGFTIKREYVKKCTDTRFDGTLLFQLYLLAEVVLKYPSVYYPEILVRQYAEGTPLFGTAAAEKGLYEPGKISVRNSVHFVAGFFTIARYIDEKYKLSFTRALQQDMSKYAYPILAIQRGSGLGVFLNYARSLTELGLNATWHFSFYTFILAIFGRYICDTLIVIIKKVLGTTPRL